MKQYTLDEKINATNHACDVLTDTRLKLQKAFGVKPDVDDLGPDWLKKASEIFGADLFGG